ncbi:MAG: DNA-deoxyinosine glycosylase [Acholeplasmatales bacterium]|jgi:hypoxanthine-DNA glycosylase|nr:DNA-deoxyinosine glycosylase [Acholeplasmatales bacterium]
MEKQHPFMPIYNAASEILILGSLPSVESVKRGFYYMHPENRFWKVLSRIYEEDAYHMSIEDKSLFILKHHLALYDIIYSCTIKNSSDSSITNPICTNIKEVLRGMNTKKILLNGKTAYQIFIKQYPELKEIAICLPSTSSANARVSLDALTLIWKEALKG